MILKLTTLCCGLLLLMASQQEVIKPLEILDTVLGFVGAEKTPFACLFTRQQTNIIRNDCIKISAQTTYFDTYPEKIARPTITQSSLPVSVSQQIPFIWSQEEALKFDFAGIRYPFFAFSDQQVADDPVVQVMPWTEKEDRFYAYKTIKFGKTPYSPIYATLVGVDTRFSQAITAAIYIPSPEISKDQVLAFEFTKKKATENGKFNIVVSFIGKWSSEADGANSYLDNYTEFASNIQSFVLENSSGVISMDLTQISINEKNGSIQDLGKIDMKIYPDAFKSELYVQKFAPLINDLTKLTGKFNNASFLKKGAIDFTNSQITLDLSKPESPEKSIVLIKVSSFRLQEFLPPGSPDQSGKFSLNLKFTAFNGHLQTQKNAVQCKNTLKNVIGFKLLDLSIEKRSLGHDVMPDLNLALKAMFTTTAKKHYFKYDMLLDTPPRRTFYYCLPDKDLANTKWLTLDNNFSGEDKDNFGALSLYKWPADFTMFQKILNNPKKMEKCASFKHNHFFIFFKLDDNKPQPQTDKFKDNYICTDNDNVYAIQKFNFVSWGTADRRKLRKS